MSDPEIHKSEQHEILVVDDNLASLRLLTVILEHQGYIVRPSSSGRLALRSVATKVPDLILLDVKIPDLDGYEICRRLKSDEQSRKVPVIFISALGETAEKVEGFQAGGVDYITKPFEAEEVLARVGTHLRLRELTEHLEQEVCQRTVELTMANEQLRQTSQRLERTLKFTEALLSAIPNPVFYKDREGRYLGCNRAFTEIMGVTSDQIMGKTVLELWPSEQAEVYHQKDLTLMNEPVRQVYEFVVRDKNGGERKVIFGKDVFCDENEQVAGIVGAFTDITERQRTEEALRQSEEKYRTLFEDSGDAICITNREGRFIDMNQSALDLFGYTGEEIRNGLNVSDLYVDPEDRERFQGEVEQKGSVKNFELRLRKKTGQTMDCLLTSSLKVSIDGAVLGYQTIIRDVTEREQARRALLESEARYRAVVEDQTELICRFFPGGIISFVNEAYCRYFGKRREDLIGHSFMPFIPEEDHPKVEEHFATLGLENPVATHEHRVITPTGEIKWLQWTNRVVFGQADCIVGFQSVGRDVTERRLMEEALQKSAEDIKFFAYSVSHDLKSPAIGLYGLTKLLQRSYQDQLDEKGRSYCDQIMKTAEQISTLVEKINLYISTKHSPPNVEIVKPREILQIVKDEFSYRLSIRQLNWKEPEYLPEIQADKLGLMRILKNLVDNALKYGGDDLSEIQIAYAESDRFHILSVSNNGVGIENSEKIFDPFQRNKSSRGVEGTGLGLAIVKEIANQHGGQVWVESSPEKGTTFFVSIAKDI